MELPISSQSYRPSPDALVRAIKRVKVILGRTTAEETQLDCATAFTNPHRPTIGKANFVVDVHLADNQSSTQSLDLIHQHFQNNGANCRSLSSIETHWPTELAEHIELRGYLPSQSSIYLLSEYKPPTRTNTDIQIIPGRSAYGQLRQLYRESGVERYELDGAAADDLAATYIDHLDEPRKEVFLGRIDGQAIGLVSLTTLGQIGVLNDVYTAKDFRKRGIARTLIAHAINHCQRALFEQVILEIMEDNHEARRVYQQLGFKAVAAIVTYRLPQ